MKDVVKVSTVNFNAKWGDKAANLSRMLGYIETAVEEGAKIIAFPEMALTGYDDEEEKPLSEKMQMREAEVVPGPSSEAVAELTKRYGVYVVFGMPERDPSDPNTLYNSACVCGPQGVIGAYRKMHLPYPEYHWATRGDKPMMFTTEWGPVGVCICYDTYCFPEMTRYYAAMGCRLHINCTAYAKCHGDFLTRSTTESYAAINDMYIVSSNLVGVDLYNDFWGGSNIVGPSVKPGGFSVDYYAGYPFADPAGYVNTMYTGVVDLGFSKRAEFRHNPGIGGKTDYRPSLYKKMVEEILKSHPEYVEE